MSLALLAACGETEADPDLTVDQRIERKAMSFDEAADEAVRIIEEDAAKQTEKYRAEQRATVQSTAPVDASTETEQ